MNSHSDSPSTSASEIQSTVDSALLDAVLNTAVDAIVTIDERGKILHANRSVEKIFGYKPHDLIGMNVSMLMPEPDRSRHNAYISTYQDTGKRKIIGIGRQVLGQRADGLLIPIDLAISEVRVGSRVLYTGIMRDMTERQQTEADLKLAQLRLIQSERLAAIGQMMTGLAHESRNALQRSRACLDMLDLDLESAPEQRDLVRRIRSALVELQTLYEEVRSYAAPIQLGKTRQTIAELCAEVWANLEEQRKHLDVRLEIDCGDCPAIYCDAQRVSQVIRNIYENALAVSPKGSTLFTTCRPVQHSQIHFVQVCFTDDGPGLSEEQRQRIFEPFFTTKTKGTGLGMAICQRLVEAHAGRIYVGEQEHRHPKAHGAVMVMELPI
ncbi:MAG: PAS domain S-box protein [Planctomycetes bacterium]|nr:PAS domain S-box protein [Planctomycetota bacterium]